MLLTMYLNVRKLPLYLSNTLWRCVGTWRRRSHHYKPLHYMDVSGQLNVPYNLTYRNRPRHVLNRRLSGPRAGVAWWRRGNYVPLPKIEPRTSRPLAISFTDCGIPDPVHTALFSIICLWNVTPHEVGTVIRARNYQATKKKYSYK
jgi:hypothetical protein